MASGVGLRVHLVQLGPADASEVAAACRASVDLHRPWTHPPLRASAWRHALAPSDRRVILGGRLRSDGDLVGVVNISEIVRGAFCSAYLGYEAFVPHAGRGLLRETLGLTVDLTFTPESAGGFGLHRVEANIQPDNHRSIALVRSLGFRNEGFSPRYLRIAGAWRDHERWAVTAEEWRPFATRGDGQNSRSSPESSPRSAS